MLPLHLSDVVLHSVNNGCFQHAVTVAGVNLRSLLGFANAHGNKLVVKQCVIIRLVLNLLRKKRVLGNLEAYSAAAIDVYKRQPLYSPSAASRTSVPEFTAPHSLIDVYKRQIYPLESIRLGATLPFSSAK